VAASDPVDLRQGKKKTGEQALRPFRKGAEGKKRPESKLSGLSGRE
jgi:hypothetical protein